MQNTLNSQNSTITPIITSSISSAKSFNRGLNVVTNNNQSSNNAPDLLQLTTDDYNFNRSDSTSAYPTKENRSLQIQNKRSQMFLSLNGKSPTSDMNDPNLSQSGRGQLNSFTKEEEEQLEQGSQQLINTSQLSQNKRKIRIEKNLNSPLIIQRQPTLESQFANDPINIQNQSGIFKNNKLLVSQKSSNIGFEEINKTNNSSKIENDQEDFDNNKKKFNNTDRKLKQQTSIGSTISVIIKNEEQSPTKIKKKHKSNVNFTENTFHYFEVSEKADFFAQFMYIQREAAQEASKKYEGDDVSNLKGILKVKNIIKSQKLINDVKEEDNKSSADTPTSLITSRKRQIISVPLQSNFGKQAENEKVEITKNENEKLEKQIKKAKRVSTTKVFGNLKGSYEKDNYIKRLSSVQHVNVERLHQLIKNKENMRMKYQRILFSLFYLIKNILTLNLIQIDSLEHSTINFYSAALKSSRMFWNASATGTIFFLYCYFNINNVSELTWPFISTMKETEDKTIFIEDQSTQVALFGVILQLLIIIFGLSEVFAHSSLFSEKQAVRLIFNSIKWNNFCSYGHKQLLKKYKLYDKIMEDQDIYEEEYPQTTYIFFIFIEVSLLLINSFCLYFLLDDSKLLDQLNSFSIFQDYSIFYNIVVGLIIAILIILNQQIIQLVYLKSMKISFSKSESLMIWTMSFNTLFIFVIFQSKQIINFNDNFDFRIVSKQIKSTPVIHQVQGQIGFIISLTIIYIFKSIFHLLVSIRQKSNQYPQQSNRIQNINFVLDDNECIQKVQDLKNVLQEENDLNNNFTQISKEVFKDNIIKNQIEITKNFKVTEISEPENSPMQLISSFKANECPENDASSSFQPKKDIQNQQNNKNKDYPLILESAFYGKQIIQIAMINSCILICVFTYPFILPIGIIINFILITSLYIEAQQINLSSCQTFLTTKQFSSIMSTIIYIFLMVSISLNCIIGMSNFENSNIQISKSLFQSGFHYLIENNYINQILYIISLPYLIYAIILYLIAFAWRLNSSHKDQFGNFKQTISKLRINPGSSKEQSISKQLINN